MGRSIMMQSVRENVKSVRGTLNNAYKKVYTIEYWRKTILIVCVVALGIDPLYLFVPVIDSPNFCFTFDKKLGVGVSVLRSFIDVFYALHIIFNFFNDPRSQKTSSGEFLHSGPAGKRRHLFYSIIDILSVLPIPQVIVLTFMHRSDSLVSREILKWIILSQYIPRIIRIYPLYKEVTRESGTVAETKWIGAAFNLFLYMLHSHVFGAFWYYCKRGDKNNIGYLNTSCPLIDPDEITNSTVFNFGMYIDALKSGIVEVKPDDFPRKFFYCFWWGLRNISALGQNLKTSNSVGDIVFALIICVSGLLLFAVLIGNIQKYLQSTTVRVDEMEEQKRDIEKWMSNHKLPENLKERIKSHEDKKWRQTRGIKEDKFLDNLPEDLKHDIHRHRSRNLSNDVSSLYPF
ncbi:hypothetical protein Bca4012_018828 [Brassica carinata]